MGRTADRILQALGDGVPHSSREVIRSTRLSWNVVYKGLDRLWRGGRILRSADPVLERKGVFRGRAGKTRNLRRAYLFLAVSASSPVTFERTRFVPYSDHIIVDSRGHRGPESKVQIIRSFLEAQGDHAFYSTQIYEALKDRGVTKPDVMASIRLLEQRGLVYVRGYQTGEKSTPFQQGYLSTWIDPAKPRDVALREAVDRTTETLEGEYAISPIIARIHRIKDHVIAASHLRELVSRRQIVEKLDCTEYEANHALLRALQLYPKLREVRLFNLWRYYYHTSLAEDDLQVAIAMQSLSNPLMLSTS